MAGEIPPILVQIQADVANLKAGLAQAESSLKGLDDNVNKTGGAFDGFTSRLKQVGATLGVTFAASQVVSFFKESIAAAVEAEQAQSRLRTILLNTGGATEAQIVALNKQAEALAKVGVVSKENITVTQSQLATFDLQGKTINALTPAILDYVTAEKGATASADDFRSMTNGLAQALNGNFASLTKQGFVLSENQKKLLTTGTESERAAALTEILNSTYKDFNKTLAQTPEGRIIKLKQEFGDVKEEIGAALLPVMEKFMSFLSKTVIPGLEKLIEFIKENITELKAFVITLGIGATAWGIYTLAVKRATIAEKALQLVQKANPIGIIITAVALLVAGMVKLFKSNETFRKAVITMAKTALTAFASIIPIIARVYEAILKVVTGPMRAFLTALSKLPGVGKFAKAALDIVNKGLDGISKFGDKASKKAKELAANLDKVGKAAKKSKKDMDEMGKGDPFKGSKDPAGEMSKDEKKRLDKVTGLQKKIAGIYEKMQEAIEEAQEKAAEALVRRNERMAEAHERYHEKVAELNEEYQEALTEAQERYDETVKDARERNAENLIEIQKDYNQKVKDLEERREETVANLRQNAAEKLASLEENYQERITELRKNAEEKAADIVRAGAEKRQSILQQSIDRLRSAFASGTAFNIAEMFKETSTGEGLLENLRKKLEAAKQLQQNAATLAAQGYSQTFIEQVVKAGPEAGNKIAEALAQAGPESTNELQSLYKQLEDLNATGLDALGEAMNAGGNLATRELIKAYEDANVEIKEKLSELNTDLQDNLTKAHRDYAAQVAATNAELNKGLQKAQEDFDKAMADAARIRDERIADSLNALNKALVKAEEDLLDAQLKAKKRLDEGLAEAAKTLANELAAAQAEYESAIKEINKRLNEQLEDLHKQLAEAAKELAALGAVKEAQEAIAQAPVAPVISPVPSPVGVVTATGTPTGTPIPIRAVTADGSIASFRAGEEKSMAGLTITQNFTNVTADAWDIHEKTLSAIRYGQAVTPKPTPRRMTAQEIAQRAR